MKPPKKMRLDLLCVDQGLAPTRARAQALILAGKVLVDEQPVSKAGTAISPSAVLRLRGQDMPFVSRGGLKLQAALEAFAVDVSGAVALDVGASTGGFTDCLLQRGARHVYAVDVGYGQLAWKLRQDPRVTCIERVNARHLQADQLRQAAGYDVTNPDAAPPGAEPDATTADELWPPTMAVMDVSFISLTLVLPALPPILGPSRSIFALVKPQFEAGREEVGKGGVVRDPGSRARALARVLDWARGEGYSVKGQLDCPVHGPKGNVEFLAWLETPST